MLVPGTAIFKVPDTVSVEVGATAMCAGATLFNALEGVGGRGHRSILIMGMGMLGLWALLISVARGFEKIVCLDLDEERLTIAKEAGATGTIHMKEVKTAQVLDKVRSQAPTGVDVCVDLTGQPETISLGFQSLRIGGTAKLVGSVTPVGLVTMDPFLIVKSSLSIDGVHNYHPRHLQQALRFAAKPEHGETIRKNTRCSNREQRSIMG